jgi:hypothetical protein
MASDFNQPDPTATGQTLNQNVRTCTKIMLNENHKKTIERIVSAKDEMNQNITYFQKIKIKNRICIAYMRTSYTAFGGNAPCGRLRVLPSAANASLMTNARSRT